MNRYQVISLIVYILSILMASYSQILLKKGSKAKNIYLNKYTIIGYMVMMLSTFCTLYAYKNVALSLGQLLQALSFIFVIILSRLLLKEQISKRQIIGIMVIIAGIVVFNI